ncbi:MAG: hypothetical protein LT102_11945 [Burkholderiaceae bacterium]|nr:hypothetical protein [Burkholderiaceae bacterium]
MRTKIALILASAVALHGCGGGGGDEGPTAPELTRITEANAQKSVGTVYRAAASLYEASHVSSDLAGGLAAPKSTGARRKGLVAFSVQRLSDFTSRLPAATDSGAGLATKAALSETLPCSSGAVHVVADVQQPDRVSSGDRVTATFDACVEQGVQLDGIMKIDELSLDARTSARFAFDGFRMTDGTDTGQIDGSFRLAMPATIDSAAFVAIDLTEVSLRIAENGRTATLQNVNSRAEIRFMTDEFRYTLQGRVADSADGVSVDVSTETPFSGAASRLDAGAMRIAGAESSHALAIVSSPDHFTIRLDADGDGTFEKTFDEVPVGAL